MWAVIPSDIGSQGIDHHHLQLKSWIGGTVNNKKVVVSLDVWNTEHGTKPTMDRQMNREF